MFPVSVSQQDMLRNPPVVQYQQNFPTSFIFETLLRERAALASKLPTESDTSPVCSPKSNVSVVCPCARVSPSFPCNVCRLQRTSAGESEWENETVKDKTESSECTVKKPYLKFGMSAILGNNDDKDENDENNDDNMSQTHEELDQSSPGKWESSTCTKNELKVSQLELYFFGSLF